jgi:putative ABC transport system permease protein
MKLTQPPRWANRLLEWFVAPYLLEDVQGDLHEVFYKRVSEVGRQKAQREFVWAVLNYLNPFFFKRKPRSEYRTIGASAEYPSPSLLSINMLRNYFKIAFRNLAKHKSYSFINIAGLTLGLTACILISLFVWDEHQYDRFLADGDQVYRVYNEHVTNQGTNNMAVSPPMFTTTLQSDFPEVEKTARVMMTAEYKQLFEFGENKFYEQSGFFVDSTFFDLFPLSFKYGTPVKALDNPASIVISQEMAERLFGGKDPVGKIVAMNKHPYQVKGVFQKNPKFHLQFNFLVPIAALQIPAERMQSWVWSQFYNYVKVKKGTDIPALEEKFQRVVKQKSAPFIKVTNTKSTPFFQPLKNIHLYSASFEFDMAQRGNITYVNALTIIAVFILLIACFNFVNLATAKSLQRAKEVGVRKTIGAGRKQLMMQFIGETTLLIFISLLLSVGLVSLGLPWLNSFTNKQITMGLFLNPVVVISMALSVIGLGILAGFYPALVLSGFKPVKVLNGSVSRQEEPGRIPWLRHGLVVVQFSLSVLLIISAIVVFKQVDYLNTKDLGFNKEQIMFFPMRGDNLEKNQESFKNELLHLPGIAAVSIGYGFPGDAVAGDEIIVPRKGENLTQSATQLLVDYDYIKTLGLQVIAGRDFLKEMKTDQDQAFIINETAVKQLGFGTVEKAIGQTLAWHPWEAKDPDSLKIGKVIGVVKDFNYKSLYDKVQVAILQIYPPAYWKVAVKMQAKDVRNSVDNVQKVWDKFTPDYPIEYKFLDENFEQMYKSEDKLRSLLGIFTTIAIFIGCLGLFGLAAYTAEQRTKEIGVRKVLGASVSSIVGLLSKDFLKLVLIAIVIASPIAGYVMNQWLRDFAYKIDIEWWIFALAGLLAIGIALLTVSFQSIKAALMNPVTSLRSE